MRSTPLPSYPMAIDDPQSAAVRPADLELRVALAAQRDRAIGFTFSAVAAVLANLAGVLPIRYPEALALLSVGYLSTLFFAWRSRRAWKRGRPIHLVAQWVLFDVALITAVVPFTGGLDSPWWLWYLACAGTAALHLGTRFAIAGAVLTAALYVGVLAGLGAIHGLDHGFLLALSRLVFLGGAAVALLLNTRKLRESRATIHRLNGELLARTRELLRLNSELQDMADLLRDVSLRDALTGLHNRRYLEHKIQDDSASQARRPLPDRRAQPAGHGCGVLMLDLDHLQEINDELGQATGDSALKHLARVLRGSLRKDETIVRWAGDEFVVLLERVTPEQTELVAQKVASALRAEPLPIAGRASRLLTASVGWTFLDASTRHLGQEGWDLALQAADGALGAAKRDGRNCVRGGALPPGESGEARLAG